MFNFLILIGLAFVLSDTIKLKKQEGEKNRKTGYKLKGQGISRSQKNEQSP